MLPAIRDLILAIKGRHLMSRRNLIPVQPGNLMARIGTS
jgi:hypothetical protein